MQARIHCKKLVGIVQKIKIKIKRYKQAGRDRVLIYDVLVIETLEKCKQIEGANRQMAEGLQSYPG